MRKLSRDMKKLLKDYYVDLNFNYSRQMLMNESAMVHYAPFRTGKTTGSWFDHAPTWLQGKVNDTRLYREVNRLKKRIEKHTGSQDVRPRFYRQEKNTMVPMHADHNTLCCVNIVLSTHAAPIRFEDVGEVQYKCALLNITERHMVPKFVAERVLLKFSIFDVSYEKARERLKDYVPAH